MLKLIRFKINLGKKDKYWLQTKADVIENKKDILIYISKISKNVLKNNILIIKCPRLNKKQFLEKVCMLEKNVSIDFFFIYLLKQHS